METKCHNAKMSKSTHDAPSEWLGLGGGGGGGYLTSERCEKSSFRLAQAGSGFLVARKLLRVCQEPSI